MNEIEKLLSKIKKKDLKFLLLVIRQLHKDYTKVPGVKKIIVGKFFFRVRVDNYRIIFKINKDDSGEVVKLKRHNDNTYKNL